MKAMVLRGPRDLALAEVDRPSSGPGQVLVRLTHSGICGTDLHIYEGAIPVRHPLIMGHEMIGEVAEEVVDGGDGRFKPGDRVIVDPAVSCGACFNCLAGQTNLCPNGVLLGRDANGGFAEFIAAPISQVFKLPDAIGSREAPLIQVLTTCLHAIRSLQIFTGQSAVVMGLGVTGQLHIQLAKACGAHSVIGVTRSAWKRSLASKLGADITLASGAECLRGVSEATDGLGADFVIETTGMGPSIADAISILRPGGTLLLFGITTAAEMKLPFYQLYYKELKILCSRAAKGEDFPASIDLIARGAVKLEPLVTQVVALPELANAIGMLESDSDQRMKIIMENVPA
jgi:L-iditol 2-dehydrogenase